jgi:hypothetical protein
MDMRLPTERSEATLLRRALLGNAVFSAICGALIVMFDGSLASLMTHVQYRLWPLGAMLLGFSATLLWFSTRPTVSSAWVNSVIAADLAWVAGTVVLLAGWHGVLTVTGTWILATIGLLVFAFAELQWLGLRRLKGAATRR